MASYSAYKLKEKTYSYNPICNGGTSLVSHNCLIYIGKAVDNLWKGAGKAIFSGIAGSNDLKSGIVPLF